MCCIASLLSLITLVAGAFLLAKTIKDELGAAFRWLSYFVIFASLAIFICSVCHDFGRCMGNKGSCPMMKGCESQSSCEHEGRMMGGHGCEGMSGSGDCDKMSGSSCKGMMKDCPMMQHEDKEAADSLAGH